MNEVVQVARYVTIQELAEIYRVHVVSLYQRSDLPGEVRLGRRRLIDVAEFDRAVRAGEVGCIPVGRPKKEAVTV